MQVNGNDLEGQDGAGFENGWLAGTVQNYHRSLNTYDVLLEVGSLTIIPLSNPADNVPGGCSMSVSLL